MLDEPKLVTLIPDEEEEELPVTEELKVFKRLAIDVAVLVGLKVGMIIATRRLSKTIRKLNDLDFPTQRTHR